MWIFQKYVQRPLVWRQEKVNLEMELLNFVSIFIEISKLDIWRTCLFQHLGVEAVFLSSHKSLLTIPVHRRASHSLWLCPWLVLSCILIWAQFQIMFTLVIMIALLLLCFSELLDLANAYCEQQLKELCEQILKHGVNVDNVATLYSTAITHQSEVSLTPISITCCCYRCSANVSSR